MIDIFLGLNCTFAHSNPERAAQNNTRNSAGVRGLAVGITVLILFVAVIVCYVFWRYRKHGRCVWPRIFKRPGLSITADDVLDQNTQCELDNTDQAY